MVEHKRISVPRMDITGSLPRPDVARLVPLEVALQLRAVPLAAEDGVLTVAMARPDDRESIDLLAGISGYRVFPVWSPPEQLQAALERFKGLCQSRGSG